MRGPIEAVEHPGSHGATAMPIYATPLTKSAAAASRPNRESSHVAQSTGAARHRATPVKPGPSTLTTS
jgi:hypothetical protein